MKTQPTTRRTITVQPFSLPTNLSELPAELQKTILDLKNCGYNLGLITNHVSAIIEQLGYGGLVENGADLSEDVLDYTLELMAIINTALTGMLITASAERAENQRKEAQQ